VLDPSVVDLLRVDEAEDAHEQLDADFLLARQVDLFGARIKLTHQHRRIAQLMRFCRQLLLKVLFEGGFDALPVPVFGWLVFGAALLDHGRQHAVDQVEHALALLREAAWHELGQLFEDL